MNSENISKLNDEAHAFGIAILNSFAYKNYLKAREEFRNDDSAKEAARIYNKALADYQMIAQWGGITPEDEKKFEDAKNIARQNTVLNNFFLAQENLFAYYKELNEYLSKKLKFNFAELAKPAGGCCG